MKAALLDLLCCPQSGQMLDLDGGVFSGNEIRSGWLVSRDGRNCYPIRDCVPRFVPESNYADSFGMQWNKFRRTQLDSYTGHPISANRFWDATGWMPDDLAGKWVLDVGCGSGRFAEVALSAGAQVVAVDYSSAVDACYANLGHHANLHVIQGDIYELPFIAGAFPFVYSLGVLQHTPDVEKAFRSVLPMLSDGGRICVDFYEKSWKTCLLPKYWLRSVTRRISKKRLLSALVCAVPKLLALSVFIGGFPLLGSYLKRLIPVANYVGSLPLNKSQQLDWSLLDTFDWLSPEHDHPQKPATVQRWLEGAGLGNVEVLKAGHLVGRGIRG